MLDSQSTDIRALVTDPRGPDGLLPLDPLTCERLPEGVLARALTQLRAVADAPVADQRELERRVALERARADDIARACEVRVTAALAAQLSAEQRYDQQDAEHERSTRELREQLAAAQDALRRQTGGASTELTTLTTAVAETRHSAGRRDTSG